MKRSTIVSKGSEYMKGENYHGNESGIQKIRHP